MLLPEDQVQQLIEGAKTAFPKFSDWEYKNEPDREYTGFTLWGQFNLAPERPMSLNFFITFSLDKGKWLGELTTGQHAYMWSSTKDGDALILWTEYCNSFESAVVELKKKILTLFQAFSVV